MRRILIKNMMIQQGCSANTLFSHSYNFSLFGQHHQFQHTYMPTIFLCQYILEFISLGISPSMNLSAAVACEHQASIFSLTSFLKNKVPQKKKKKKKKYFLCVNNLLLSISSRFQYSRCPRTCSGFGSVHIPDLSLSRICPYPGSVHIPDLSISRICPYPGSVHSQPHRDMDRSSISTAYGICPYPGEVDLFVMVRF